MTLKILVTGSSGFIGGWILKKYDFCVGLPRYACDIRDYECLDKAFSSHNPSHVIHLAAISNPEVCKKNPDLAWDVNVGGTENVLKLCKKYGCKATIASTAFVYLFDDVYTKTKKECEKLAEEHGAVIARPFHQEGPGRPFDYFTSMVILAGLTGKEFDLYNPDFVREFMDVRDGADAFVKITLSGSEDAIYDICTGKGYSKLEYIHMVEKVINKKIKFYITDKIKKGKLVGDPTALYELGWKQKYDVMDTIKDQVEYVKEVLKRDPHRKVIL